MFRKLVLATPVAAMLLLSGCATVPPSVTSIQSLAVTICGFLPTAETIAGIIAAGNPLLATGEAIANAICAAVTPAQLSGRKRAMLPSVGNVVVHGRFVR